MRGQGSRVSKTKFRNFSPTRNTHALTSQMPLQPLQCVCSYQPASTSCVRHCTLTENWVLYRDLRMVCLSWIVGKNFRHKSLSLRCGLPDVVTPAPQVLNISQTSSARSTSRPWRSTTFTSDAPLLDEPEAAPARLEDSPRPPVRCGHSRFQWPFCLHT